MLAVAYVLDRVPDRQHFIDTFDRASRLILRLRQKVVAPPLPLFLPSWIVDPDFDLGFHLRFGRLPAPGSLFRPNPRTLAVLGPGAALWLYAITSPVRREIVIAAMGHLGELILAAAFIFKALAAVGWRRPDLERPLGAFLGFFVAIHTMLFARRLIRDHDFLAWYREGKGGALMNDLESIVLDLHIWTGTPLTIEDAARALLVVAVVALGAAVALGALRHRLRPLASSLLEIR